MSDKEIWIGASLAELAEKNAGFGEVKSGVYRHNGSSYMSDNLLAVNPVQGYDDIIHPVVEFDNALLARIKKVSDLAQNGIDLGIADIRIKVDTEHCDILGKYAGVDSFQISIDPFDNKPLIILEIQIGDISYHSESFMPNTLEFNQDGTDVLDACVKAGDESSNEEIHYWPEIQDGFRERLRCNENRDSLSEMIDDSESESTGLSL